MFYSFGNTALDCATRQSMTRAIACAAALQTVMVRVEGMRRSLLRITGQ
jgi:hypothetical protein